MLTYLREWLFPRTAVPSPILPQKQPQEASTLRVVKLWWGHTEGKLHLGPLIYPVENDYLPSRYVTYETPTHIVRVVYPQTLAEIEQARHWTCVSA